MVIPEHPAQAFTAANHAGSFADFVVGLNQHVVSPLMSTFTMIMSNGFRNRLSERFLAKANQPVQAFGFQTSHEPFQRGIPIRGTGRQPDRLDASQLKTFAKFQSELRIPIQNQLRGFSQGVIIRIRPAGDSFSHHLRR